MKRIEKCPKHVFGSRPGKQVLLFFPSKRLFWGKITTNVSPHTPSQLHPSLLPSLLRSTKTSTWHTLFHLRPHVLFYTLINICFLSPCSARRQTFSLHGINPIPLCTVSTSYPASTPSMQPRLAPHQPICLTHSLTCSSASLLPVLYWLKCFARSLESNAIRCHGIFPSPSQG